MQSFENFVTTLSPDYPLNVVAQAYWQDWLDQQPIDGGVAYETQLRSIILDGSLQSLATLDKFLTAVKPQLASDAILLSQNTAQRNLLTFIGFYAGLVFCYQAKESAYWVSFAHLTTAFPPLLKLISDDFSYSMGVSSLPVSTDVQPFMPMVMNQTTFFPLVTIVERLYPARNPAMPSPLHAPFFGFVSNSLATSVEKLLQQTRATLEVSATTVSPVLQTPLEKLPELTSAQPIESLSSPQMMAEPVNALLANLEKPNRLRFNQFKANKLLFLAENPFISLKPKQPYVDEALFEPYGHPFVAPPTPVSPQTAITSNNIDPDIIAVVAEAEHAMVATDKLAVPPNTISKQSPVALSRSQAVSQHAMQKISAEASDAPVTARKKLTAAELSQAQQTLKNQAKEQKARQEALKKSIAEKAEQKRQQEIAAALANPRIHEGLLKQSHSMLDIAKRHQQQTDSYSELEAELNEPELQALVSQQHSMLFAPLEYGKSWDEMYQNSKQVLVQINAAIQSFSEQHPERDLQLSEQQQGTIAQAVNVIETTANAGHPEAMLWLALHTFRGDNVFGIAQNPPTALEWLNRAGKLGDCRAEKLLSKLYYRGESVPLDAELGKYWLELAAEHGHPEAKTISQQMAIATLLKENRKDDSNYMRMLLWGVAVLVTLAFLAVAFIKV